MLSFSRMHHMKTKFIFIFENRYCQSSAYMENLVAIVTAHLFGLFNSFNHHILFQYNATAFVSFAELNIGKFKCFEKVIINTRALKFFYSLSIRSTISSPIWWFRTQPHSSFVCSSSYPWLALKSLSSNEIRVSILKNFPPQLWNYWSKYLYIYIIISCII